MQTSLWSGSEPLRFGLSVLRAIRRPLFEGAASLDRQLAALAQRCGSSGDSSGAGSSLPSAAQLQAAWAVLVTGLPPGGIHQKLQQAEVAALHEQAAQALLSLQPDNPRSSYHLGIVAAMGVTNSSASRRRGALQHFRRGAELARAQGSDFWLARWAGC